VGNLINLTDVVYTIGNFDKKIFISVIFSTFAHLRKYEKKLTVFVKYPQNDNLFFIMQLR